MTPVSQPPASESTRPEPIWQPSNPSSTAMAKYRERVNQKFNLNLRDSHQLHAWSTTSPHDFWIDLYSYCNIVPPLPKGTKHAYDSSIPLRDIPPFFPGLELNYAENVLEPNTRANPQNVALVGLRENKLDDPENITWEELCELVRLTRSAMVRYGVKKSDVVAVLMANSVWAIVIFLASASIGAIFTSVSPDMGAGGCVSRFAQVSPKLLFCDIDLSSKGTRPSILGKVQQILKALPPSVTTPQVIFVPAVHAPHLRRNYYYLAPLGWELSTFISTYSRPNDKLNYTRLPTSHPLVILYSSGTTGAPKCIASPHMAILNFKKIAYLHNSLGPDSTVFQYSSTSWVVWNVMNGHLSVGAKTICYDGGALWPNASTMLKILEKYRATYWGTSPRYLLELEQQSSTTAQVKPSNYDLSALRMVTTTGALLTAAQQRWFYTAFPSRIHLSSIAGGTEVNSSWVASDPAGPVHAGEMQMWALGHACDILDETSLQSLQKTNQPGELICRLPFPSMPCFFWGDTSRQKYREAYFERFPLVPNPRLPSDYLDVWTQHDRTQHPFYPHTQGIQILARSDSTLNPSGIRFGPADIYGIVESSQFNSIVSDSLCVGRRRPQDPDETVFLFLVLHPAHPPLEENLRNKIKSAIRTQLSPRHIPKVIEQVREIPYTINGKKVEIAVKKIISAGSSSDQLGLDDRAISTVVNAACLYDYVRFRDWVVKSDARKSGGVSGGERAKL